MSASDMQYHSQTTITEPVMTKAVLLIMLQAPAGHSAYKWSSNSLSELEEYCKFKNYEVTAAFTEESGLLFEDAAPSTKLILELGQTADDIILITAGEFREIGDEQESKTQINKWKTDGKIRTETIWHPCFPSPGDSQQRIWRYMDLPKFLDLIQTKKLHFTREDELKKSEPHEGKNFTALMHSHINKIEIGAIPSPWQGVEGREFARILRLQEESARDSHWCFINCWHVSPVENFAMWKIYSEKFGLCIESNIQSLRASFQDERWSYYDAKDKIYIGKVIYYEEDSHWMPQGNLFWRHMHKRREFSYEQELRCIIADASMPLVVRPIINLETLITNVHISPFAPD
jgi:hypothetical protein